MSRISISTDQFSRFSELGYTSAMMCKTAKELEEAMNDYKMGDKFDLGVVIRKLLESDFMRVCDVEGLVKVICEFLGEKVADIHEEIENEICNIKVGK